jgi:hypothetical protein
MRFFPLFIGLALAACSSSSSPSNGSADASVPTGDDDAGMVDAAIDAAPTCPGPTPRQTPDACKQCQDEKCCITATAAAAKPNDAWTTSAALICRQDNCATECGTAAPVCGNITPDPASCKTALDEACCSQIAACGNSDECLAIVYLCIDDDGCDPTTTCFAPCRDKYPNGAKIFDAMNACSQNVSCP